MSLHTQLRRGPLALALLLALTFAATIGARAATECRRIEGLVRESAASVDVASISLLGGRLRLPHGALR